MTKMNQKHPKFIGSFQDEVGEGPFLLNKKPGERIFEKKLN